MWEVTIIEGTDDIHVHPLDDLVDHVLTKDCDCKPDVFTDKDGGCIITHTSYDLREVIEEVNAILNKE